MSEPNHYRVLGVSPQADIQEIRRAYRKIALECHPDRRGGVDCGRFQKAAAAYRVLGHPARRAAYDRQRAARSQAQPNAVAQAVWWPPPAGQTVHRFDLVLSPAEAARGASPRLTLPLPAPCPRCGGTGGDWSSLCRWCLGDGLAWREQSLTLEVPAGVRSGQELRYQASAGAFCLEVRLKVLVDPWAVSGPEPWPDPDPWGDPWPW